MYFPYLRGMRHELAAVKAIMPTISTDLKTTVIIEPVKSKLNDLDSALKTVESSGYNLKIIAIVNPIVGDKPAMIDLITLVNQYPNKIIPAFVVGNSHNRGTAADFISNTASADVAIIHDNDSTQATTDRADIVVGGKNILWDVCISRLPASYLGALTSDKVFIEDAFNRRARNADYPPEDFFSDLHTKHSPEGYAHFGDYTIMSKEYREGGGPANAVALHLLYVDAPNFRMRHFVSDPLLEPDPVGVKYGDSRTQLLGFIAADPLAYNSVGAGLFAANPNFPGLGKAKEFSIMHHLELRNL